MSPFQKTLMSQFTPYTSDAPALTRQSPQGSTQNTMAGVTALWPLERKPPIPSTRQEARHCISSSRGEWTCMSPHEMRPDSPLETPEEPRDTCQHWSGILSLWPQLQMKTSAPAANAEESQEGPSNSHGDWNSRGHMSGSVRSWLYLERNPKFPTTNRKKNTEDSPLNAR